MITRAIERAFEKAKRENWDKTYWAFDIHETMVIPNWSTEELPTSFYPEAKEVLQAISKRKDICMILYTCSHPHEIEKYREFFEEHQIHFDYANENPEVESRGYGCYDHKPYFNVLFEDKAGFDPQSDWTKVKVLINKTQ